MDQAAVAAYRKGPTAWAVAAAPASGRFAPFLEESAKHPRATTDEAWAVARSTPSFNAQAQVGAAGGQGLQSHCERECGSASIVHELPLAASVRASGKHSDNRRRAYASGEGKRLFRQDARADQLPMPLLEAQFRYFKEMPLEQVEEFNLGMFVSRLWRPIRRSLWWYALNVSGDVRGRVFGTFGVSVYSGLGAESLHPLSPTTCTLNFGTIAPDGQVDLRLIYDHRVLDGSTVARCS